jgi:hypothetical protein
MCNLELGFPRPQLNFCPPDKADEYQTFLLASEAHATTEAKEPRVAHDGKRLFPYLPAKSLLPGLIALGTATWPPPSLTIIADQHHAPVGGHAETIYPMGLAPRNRAWRTPGDQPIAAIRSNRELFAVARDTTLKHSYLHPALILQFCPNRHSRRSRNANQQTGAHPYGLLVTAGKAALISWFEEPPETVFASWPEHKVSRHLPGDGVAHLPVLLQVNP